MFYLITCFSAASFNAIRCQNTSVKLVDMSAEYKLIQINVHGVRLHSQHQFNQTETNFVLNILIFEPLIWEKHESFKAWTESEKNIYCSAIFGGGDWTIKRLQVNYKTENN